MIGSANYTDNPTMTKYRKTLTSNVALYGALEETLDFQYVTSYPVVDAVTLFYHNNNHNIWRAVKVKGCMRLAALEAYDIVTVTVADVSYRGYVKNSSVNLNNFTVDVEIVTCVPVTGTGSSTDSWCNGNAGYYINPASWPYVIPTESVLIIEDQMGLEEEWHRAEEEVLELFDEVV
jgi:hypothetical protein